MKEHEHERHHRETGGVNEAEADLREKPEARTNARKIDDAAEERKHGGEVEKKHRRKRKHGGEVHHSKCRCEKCMGGAAKAAGGVVGLATGGIALKRGGRTHAGHDAGEVHGEHHREHAGHKPRKSGGRTGSDGHPFSSAHAGKAPHGHKVENEAEMD